MKELTFKEVVANIKQGEVWESIYTKILLDKFGDIEVVWEDERIRKQYAFAKDTKYKLKREKVNFQEAFKSYEEGKEIESARTSTKYKEEKGLMMFYSCIYKRWVEIY